MINTNERASYTPGKNPKREGVSAPPTMHVFVTRPAYDGLCSKCAVHGVPDYWGISPSGEQGKFSAHKRTNAMRAYDRMEPLTPRKEVLIISTPSGKSSAYEQFTKRFEALKGADK